jgi:uncharacterized protein YdcH (DUF465 family)
MRECKNYRRDKMKLKELLGKHTLTGVGEWQTEYKELWETIKARAFSFELDNIIYTAIENPDDGYRSMLEELKKGEGKIKTKIPPTEVVCKMKPNCDFEENEILQMVDTKNGKRILEVGTGNTNDYYPYFVAGWRPENLHYNEGV